MTPRLFRVAFLLPLSVALTAPAVKSAPGYAVEKIYSAPRDLIEANVLRLAEADVVAIEPSKISLMPPGLLNLLAASEILDPLASLASRTRRMITRIILHLALFAPLVAAPLKPDLTQAPAQQGWKFAEKNTAASWVADAKGRPALRAKGIVWLDGAAFSEGTIEIDILGQSAPPQSNFLGIAFRGVDDTTYDCVYFRPFNFRSPNPDNASHAVQYVSHPEWTWSRLRKERTGRYEKPITPAPDGDAWFHAKIVIAGKAIRVFVNGATKPSLEVESLTERQSGRIGIWGGAESGQGGHFANLVITPSK